MITNKKLNSVTLASAALILYLILVSSTASADTITSTSNVVGTNYQYWSSEQYPLIDLFGEKYVPLRASTDPIWNSHVDKLAKLVIDSKDSHILITGENFDLGDGYSLQVMQVDVDGQKVWLELDKDGQYVDDEIVSTDSGDHTWTCTLDNIQGVNNVPVLKVHVNLYQGATDIIAQIDEIWLIDYANAKTIQIGDRLGDYTLITIINGVDASNLGSLVFEYGNDSATFAYITNYNDGTVSVIDTATNTVTATVPVGDRPYGVAVSPDGTKVYVAGSNNVSVINTCTNTVTATVPVGISPYGVAVTPDGTKAYVTNEYSNNVSVIDTATNKVIASVNVGRRPGGVAVTPDGTKAYVANQEGVFYPFTKINNVSVIDTATNTVTATVDVGAYCWPCGVAVTPDGKKVYVAQSIEVSIIDTATNEHIGGLYDDNLLSSMGIAITPNGKNLYVTNSNSHIVSVFNTTTKNVIAKVDVGESPKGVAVTPDGKKVYVANEESNNVSVIDTATNTVTASVDVGDHPIAFGKFIGSVPAPEPVVPFEIQITRITTSESAGLPDIYGNNIVWQNGSDVVFTNIGVYDLSTQKETQITTNPLTVPREPKIYGDRIVWMDSNNGSYDEYGFYDTFDIYMYNLSTSEKTQITTSGSASWPTAPAIHGNRIVWDESRNNSHSVYLYDLSTHKETQITDNGRLERPAVYEDRIVWEKVNSSLGNDICCQRDDVYVYNLSTNNTTKIITGEAIYYRLAIYGDNIAWQSWINGNSDVHVYNLSTGKNTQITSNGGAQYPNIYGDRIVWTDYRNGNADIYMYNLSTSRETQVTNNTAAQVCPAIYENKIVWEDGRNGGSDIYMGTLINSVDPIANFSSNVTEGYVPLSVQFTDLSTHATEWNWDFGDGTTSTDKNITHTYSVAGNYTVNLTVSNENSTDSKLAAITVLEAAPPVADFSAFSTVGKAPLTVTFTDQSTGSPISWSWKFGDRIVSTAQNPEHIYSKAGKYTVSLTVKNEAGSDTRKRSKYIIVKK